MYVCVLCNPCYDPYGSHGLKNGIQFLKGLLRSVNCISFTQWDHTLDSDFRFLKVFFQFFYNGWFFGCFTFRLCRYTLFRCLFRSCRSDELPFCGFESSFSRIILCFDLRNIVGTLCSTATCTSIGNFLWQMPSQASLTSTAKKPF